MSHFLSEQQETDRVIISTKTLKLTMEITDLFLNLKLIMKFLYQTRVHENDPLGTAMKREIVMPSASEVKNFKRLQVGLTEVSQPTILKKSVIKFLEHQLYLTVSKIILNWSLMVWCPI